jgi:hypothetical protein
MKTALLSLSLLFSIASFRAQTYTNDASRTILRSSMYTIRVLVIIDTLSKI